MEKPMICLSCGEHLPPAHRGHRDRLYCSARCRQRVYRARRAWEKRHPELEVLTEADAYASAAFAESRDPLDDAAHVVMLLRAAQRLALRVVPELPGSLPARFETVAAELERLDRDYFENVGQ